GRSQSDGRLQLDAADGQRPRSWVHVPFRDGDDATRAPAERIQRRVLFRMTTGLGYSSGSVHDALGGEDGAVLVWVAITLPLIVLLVSFVLGLGNWFAHQRHLQTQADAAALAGALEWGKCFGDKAAADAAINAAAQQYSGQAAGAYNEQIGGTSSDQIHYALNSAT